MSPPGKDCGPNGKPAGAQSSPTAKKDKASVPQTPSISESTARTLVDKVKASVDDLRDAITTLYDGRAWLALGYASWDDLCDTEFAVRIALPRAERQAVVADLSEAGMSTRAIGSALGVDPMTVSRDLSSGVANATPATATAVFDADMKPYQPAPQPITGTDGKTYPRTSKAVDRRETLCNSVLKDVNNPELPQFLRDLAEAACDDMGDHRYYMRDYDAYIFTKTTVLERGLTSLEEFLDAVGLMSGSKRQTAQEPTGADVSRPVPRTHKGGRPLAVAIPGLLVHMGGMLSALNSTNLDDLATIDEDTRRAWAGDVNRLMAELRKFARHLETRSA